MAQQDKNDSLITPPVEFNTLLWIALLGIPGGFWFLVLQKFFNH